MIDLKERLRDIEGLGQPDLWSEIERRATTRTDPVFQESVAGPSTGKRVRAGLVAAAIFLVAAGFAWAAFRPTSGAVVASPTASVGGSCHTNQGFQGIVLPHCEPFSGANRYDTLSAAGASGAKVSSLPRAKYPLDNDANITDVWVAPRYHQIQIDYANGLSVQYEGVGAKIAALSTADLVARYKLEAQQDASGTAGQAKEMTIGGVPTLVVPTDSARFANGASQHAGGSVEFILDHGSIAVAGPISTDDLIGVAASIIEG